MHSWLHLTSSPVGAGVGSTVATGASVMACRKTVGDRVLPAPTVSVLPKEGCGVGTGVSSRKGIDGAFVMFSRTVGAIIVMLPIAIVGAILVMLPMTIVGDVLFM
jgi:hypothetical protein